MVHYTLYCFGASACERLIWLQEQGNSDALGCAEQWKVLV